MCFLTWIKNPIHANANPYVTIGKIIKKAISNSEMKKTKLYSMQKKNTC